MLIFFFFNEGKAQNTSEAKLISEMKQNSRDLTKLDSISKLLLNANSPEALWEGQQTQGYVNLVNSDLDKASFYYKLSLQTAEKTGKIYPQVTSLEKLMTVKNAQGESDSLLYYINLSKTFAAENNHQTLEALAFKYEGILLRNQANYEEAITANKKAGVLFEELNNPQAINIFGNIAIIYERLQQDSLAKIWYKKAYTVAKEANFPPAKFAATNNLANHFYKKEKILDSALVYFNEIIENKYPMSPVQESVLHQNLVSLYVDKKDLETAEIYKQKLDDYWKNKPLSKRKSEYFDELSKFYKTQNELALAIAYNDSALSFAIDNQISDKQLRWLLNKSELLQANKDYESSVEVYKTYIALKDSLLFYRDAEKIQQTINEFELDSRLKQLTKNLNLEKKNNSYLWTLLLLLPVGWWAIKRRKDRKELEGKQNEKTPEYIKIAEYKKVLLSSVLYIKSEGHYLYFYLENKSQPLIERSSLKTLEEQLIPHNFIRTHKSYLVNAKHISKVNHVFIELINASEIPLSRKYKQDLKEAGHPLFS